MKFGSKYDPDKKSGGGSTGGKWIKGFKEGETRLRFLQETADWVEYYEHYNPAGTYFPCTGDRNTCPGCTSTNERMKSASRKIAVNALVGQYVDVYKLPVKLSNRLSIRSERNGGTITDRDYVITRIGMDQSTEYDLESGNAAPIDTSAYELIDIEGLLKQQFEENFPDFDPDANQDTVANEGARREMRTSAKTDLQKQKATDVYVPQNDAAAESRPPSKPAAEKSAQQEEVVITLDELEKMTAGQLIDLCDSNGAKVPRELLEAPQPKILEWMMDQFS